MNYIFTASHKDKSINFYTFASSGVVIEQGIMGNTINTELTFNENMSKALGIVGKVLGCNPTNLTINRNK